MFVFYNFARSCLMHYPTDLNAGVEDQAMVAKQLF